MFKLVLATLVAVIAVLVTGLFFLEGQEVRAARSVPVGQCSEIGAASPEGEVGSDPPSVLPNPQEASRPPEEVHFSWTRTCIYIRSFRWVQERRCRRVRINEGGGHISYYSQCDWVRVREPFVRRDCYREWREHSHAMLASRANAFGAPQWTSLWSRIGI